MGANTGTALFHLPFGEETINPSEYYIDIENQKIVEKGTPTNGYSDTTPQLIEGIPVCDVDLMFMSHVSDEETNRFRLSVYLAGYLRTEHRGGDSYSTENHQFDFMRGQCLRLVNAGPVDKVLEEKSAIPFASSAEQHDHPINRKQKSNDLRKCIVKPVEKNLADSR